jgi:predicted house-cleaning noncanonical NTP pyrophosphatase (MazG superfamily)
VRLKFEKLVRDRIPVKIRSHGERVETLNLHESELLDVLKAKLVEEALEVLSAKSAESLQEEMADVYEVLRALARSARRSPEQVQRAAARKRGKVGGFGKGIVLVETEDTPLITVKTENALFGQKQTNAAGASPRLAVAARRWPDAQHDKIIIPLIPSVPSRLRGPARVSLRHLGLSFNVTYKEKFVEIALEKNRPRVDSAQMTFPFDPIS